MPRRSTILGTLMAWALASACVAGPVVINEFMASNSAVARDPQGQYDDWIELYNPTDAAIDVGGLYLTDDLTNPTQWRIPVGNPTATTLPARGYLLIWADEDVDDEGLHCAFKLRAKGEEIALFDSDGTTPWDSVRFATQQVDLSQGRFPDGGSEWRLMYGSPTPGESNISQYIGAMAEPQVSHERGFYEVAFEVTLSTRQPEALIYYTLDGREPFGQTRARDRGTLYSGPIAITSTTTLRTRAIGPSEDWLSSETVTHT